MAGQQGNKAELGDELPEGEESDRPMRADARRNYDRLVASAKHVFAEHGADTSMEAIAKHAGVGVGTLYRHFPKRIDIVEAVYRTDVDELMVAAEKAGVAEDPWDGLVEFLYAFQRYAESKRTFMAELHEAFAKNPNMKLGTRERIESAMSQLLARAQETGTVRSDIDGPDLMQLIGPMCTSPTLHPDQAKRLLPMIVDGLRAPTA
ncbi:MAG TPA: TetR/AcrR family transcriptional regulator [Acidimicrobiales bacterium]|nr:TetR/AcrR family transcriptional regulator [Acidimicrobiales bacterium]